jgi:hypothetical protein
MAYRPNFAQTYQDSIGCRFIRPLIVTPYWLISSSGTVFTVQRTTKAYPPSTEIAIARNGTGDWTMSGLPRGIDYHVLGAVARLGVPTEARNVLCLAALDAAAGTVRFCLRKGSDGTLSDTSTWFLWLSLLVEGG